MAPKPAIDRRLQLLASAFTPEWLAAQRWFRGKSLALASVEFVDAAEIVGSAGWLVVLEATDVAGGRARYLLPVTLAGQRFREPRDGEGVWRSLAALMLTGGELSGARGQWLFTPTRAAPDLLPGGPETLPSLAERRLGVQQSNTSVALGEELMLKVYRLVQPGANPEVEMNAFLTDVGFREAPALAGSATYLLDGEPHSTAMLQELVPAVGDGWGWVLNRLATPPDGPLEAIRAMRKIGELTARLHAALASRPNAPGFPSRLATRGELGAWLAAAEAQLSAALAVLDDGARARLATAAGQITDRFAAIGAARNVPVRRIHGDYHLGQLLRARDGFVVIDFEGEPARSLVARRAAASPLRDVAGMLRSLHYAAHTASVPAGWLTDARAEFVAGYGGISPDDAPLLSAFEIEKACYEVVYEANNRPDWVWLPLEALLSGATATSADGSLR